MLKKSKVSASKASLWQSNAVRRFHAQYSYPFRALGHEMLFIMGEIASWIFIQTGFIPFFHFIIFVSRFTKLTVDLAWVAIRDHVHHICVVFYTKDETLQKCRTAWCYECSLPFLLRVHEPYQPITSSPSSKPPPGMNCNRDNARCTASECFI